MADLSVFDSIAVNEWDFICVDSYCIGVQSLWGVEYTSTTGVVNPENMLDLQFNDQVASWGIASKLVTWSVMHNLDERITNFNSFSVIQAQIRFRTTGALNNDSFILQLYDGTTWHDLETFSVGNQPPTVLTTEIYNVETILNSIAKINAAQIRFNMTKSGGVDATIEADEARIYLEFNRPDVFEGISVSEVAEGIIAYPLYVCAPIAGNWKLDDDAANTLVKDSSGFVYDGVSARNTDQFSITGKFNKALDFNGTSDYIDCGDQDTFSVTDRGLSIGIWVKCPDPLSGRVFSMVSKGSVADGWEYVVNLNPNAFEFITYQPAGATHSYVANFAIPIDDGNWHYLVAVIKDNSYARIYIDGVQRGETTSFTGSMSPGTGALFIGKRADGQNFDGILDQITVFCKALSGGEINDLWNSGAGVDPLFYFDLLNIAEDVSILVSPLNILISDNIEILEDINVYPVNTINVFDSVPIEENISLYLDVLNISVFDELIIQENVSSYLDVLNIFVLDPFHVLVTELAYVLDLVIEVGVVTEIINVSDNLISFYIDQFFISVFDEINIIENVQVSLDLLYASVFDNILILENSNIYLTDLYISISEDISISENIEISIIELFIFVSDSLFIVENISLDIPILINEEEDILVIESQDIYKTGDLDVHQNIELVEFISLETEIINLNISVNDNIEVTEILFINLFELNISINDIINLNENISIYLDSLNIDAYEPFTILVTDVAQITDLIIDVGIIIRNILVDEYVLTYLSNLQFIIYDDISFVEDLQINLDVLNIHAQITDIFSLFDIITVYMGIEFDIFDSVPITENVSLELEIIDEYINIYDFVGVQETVELSPTIFLLIHEEIIINEFINLIFSEISFNVYDNIAIFDFPIILDLVVELGIVFDEVLINEFVSLNISELFFSVLDFATITDISIMNDLVIELGIVSETLAISENFVLTLNEIFFDIYDVISIEDNIFCSITNLNINIFENILITENIETVLVNNLNVFEIINAIEDINIVSLAFRMPYNTQNATWHDGTRFWRAYYNNAIQGIVFEYTTDLTSGWTENVNARITDTGVCRDFDARGGSSTAGICYVRNGSIYGRGALAPQGYPSTNWSWDVEFTIATKGIYDWSTPSYELAGDNYFHCSITLEKPNEFSIWHTISVAPFSTTFNSPTKVSDSDSLISVSSQVVSLANGSDLIIIYTENGVLKDKKWNGSSFDEAETITSIKLNNHENKYNTFDSFYHESEMHVHILYVGADDIVYGANWVWSSGIEPSEILDNIHSDFLYCAIGLYYGGDYICFVWSTDKTNIVSNDIYYRLKSNTGLSDLQIVREAIGFHILEIDYPKTSSISQGFVIWEQQDGLYLEIIVLGIEQYENISIVENINILIPEYNIVVNDIVSVVENLEFNLNELFIYALDEIIITDIAILNDLIIELGIVEDSIAISENISIIISALFIGVSDAVSLVENIIDSIPYLLISVSETLPLVESINITLPELYLESSDSLDVVGDFNQGVTPIPLSINESIFIIEIGQITDLIIELGIVAHSLSILETITLYLNELLFSISDTVSVTENIQIDNPIVYLSTNESIGISEWVNILDIIIEMIIIDSVSILEITNIYLDNLYIFAIEELSVVEHINMTDIIIELEVSENITVQDVIEIRKGDFSFAIYEEVSITEWVNVFDRIIELFVIDYASTFDVIITDAYNLYPWDRVEVNGALTEYINIQEQASILLPILYVDAIEDLSIEEAVIMHDIIIELLVYEIIGIVEVFIGLDFVIELYASDSVSVIENLEIWCGYEIIINDNISISEYNQLGIESYVTVSDLISVVENIESITVSDTLIPRLFYVPSRMRTFDIVKDYRFKIYKSGSRMK